MSESDMNSISASLRRCVKCKKTKLLNEFYNDKNETMGKTYLCKDCTLERSKRRYYAERSEDAYKNRKKLSEAKYLDKFPEKAAAHRLAKIHKAKIMKDACEKCGNLEKLHMHHPDYSKPLEVITLCVPCHEDVHHRVKEAA